MMTRAEKRKEILKAKTKKAAKVKKKRKCTKCGKVKPSTDFDPNPSSPEGLTTHCKDCRNAHRKDRQERLPEVRLKHHIASRVQKQLGSRCPTNYVTNLERYLGYKVSCLVSSLEMRLQTEKGISLKEAFDLGWHLDHKKPLSLFPVMSIESQAFRDCWNVNNLEMISAEENLAKGASWDPKKGKGTKGVSSGSRL